MEWVFVVEELLQQRLKERAQSLQWGSGAERLAAQETVTDVNHNHLLHQL